MVNSLDSNQLPASIFFHFKCLISTLSIREKDLLASLNLPMWIDIREKLRYRDMERIFSFSYQEKTPSNLA